MATGKKSFQLYTEWIETFEELDNENAGKLIKHIFKYVNDQDPITDNLLISVSFIPIKQQLKRDLKKWKALCEKNKANIGKRWNTKNTTGINGINKNTKNTDKVEVEDKVKEINNKGFSDFWNLYNKKSSNKMVCEKKWSLLNESDRLLIMNHLVKYVNSTPDKQFRKNAETYLNQKHWMNEILSSTNGAIPVFKQIQQYTTKELKEIEQIKRAYKKQKV